MATKPKAASRLPKPAVAEVDAYIAAQGEPARSRLETLRTMIRQTAPGAVERMSYGIPTWSDATCGENLIHIAGYAKHVGVYPGAAALVAFAAEISGYPTSKGTVQLPHDRDLPVDLVRRITLWRVEQVA